MKFFIAIPYIISTSFALCIALYSYSLRIDSRLKYHALSAFAYALCMIPAGVKDIVSYIWGGSIPLGFLIVFPI